MGRKKVSSVRAAKIAGWKWDASLGGMGYMNEYAASISVGRGVFLVERCS